MKIFAYIPTACSPDSLMPMENFQPSLNVVAIVNLVGASQGLLIAIALLRARHGSRLANRYFALALVSLSLFIILAVSLETGYIIWFPHLLGLDSALVFGLGPLLYFYVRETRREVFVLRGKTLLHFFPASLFVVLWIASLFHTREQKLAEYLEGLATLGKGNPARLLVLLLVDISLFAYLLVCLRKLSTDAKQSAPMLPQPERRQSRWLRNLFVAFLVVLVLSTLMDILALDRENMRFTPLLLTIILCSLSYLGLQQAGIVALTAGAGVGRKYAKSALTESVADELDRKLRQLMEQERLYTDSTLSLPKLAKRLGVSTHHLSQIINERFQQNFHGYLSNLRIEAAKQMLLAPEAATINISEIAYAVGFNSISALSTAFKKQSGMSPSQFQKLHSNRVNPA